MRLLKKIIVKIHYHLSVRLNKWRIDIDKNIKIGKNVFIHPSARIETRFGGSIVIENGTKIWDNVLIYSYGGNIKIGKSCDINPFTIIYGHGGAKIGDNVLIAGHSMIIPNNHNFSNLKKNINDQGCTKKGIVIEENVWIAHSCSILDGVRVSKGSIIGSGSVVTKNIRANTINAGVPCKEIKIRYPS